MVLSRDAFIDALSGLGELMPMGKTLSPKAIALAWGLFPIAAKEQLDTEHLLYAMQQFLLDPQPARDLSITVQLLRYLFPTPAPSVSSTGLYGTGGPPILERGLRPDLPARMQRPDLFHPLHQQAASKPAALVLEEQRLLGPASPGVLDQLEITTKPLVHAARSVKEPPGVAASGLSAKEERLGSQLAALCILRGFSPEAMDATHGRTATASLGLPPARNLAREWISAHPNGCLAMRAAAASHRQASSRSTDAEPGSALSAVLAPEALDASGGVCGSLRR